MRGLVHAFVSEQVTLTSSVFATVRSRTGTEDISAGWEPLSNPTRKPASATQVPSMRALDLCRRPYDNERVRNKQHPDLRIARRRWALSGAVVVLLTLGLLEVALRILGLTRPVLYETDDATGFRLKPNQHIRYIGNTIDINSWGVRDPRPLTEKPANKTRILVLGDSVTWGGIRIPQEELFTSVLERHLKGTEVINAGVNGYSVARMVALYRAHLRDLNPDAVLVYAIPADFVRPVRLELLGDSVAFPSRTRGLRCLSPSSWRVCTPITASVARGSAPSRTP